MAAAIVQGIISGVVPGLLAVGLVLIYKGSRVFNFAQAEFATLGAYAAWLFTAEWSLPYALGSVLAIVVGAGVGFLVERLIVRPLFDAPRVTLLVATAGFTLLVAQTQANIGGVQSRVIDPAIGGLGPEIFGVFVSPQRLLSLMVLVGIAAGFAWFFNRTTAGLAILASSEEPFAAELAGVSAKRVSTIVWTSAGALGAVAGLLHAGGNVSILPGFMTRDFLLAAFVAAVLGGMTSLTGAFLAGELTGVLSALSVYVNREYLGGEIPGPQNVVLILVLIGVLLARPQGLFGQPEAAKV